jgi:hypothetical protein
LEEFLVENGMCAVGVVPFRGREVVATFPSSGIRDQLRPAVLDREFLVKERTRVDVYGIE